MDNRRVITYLKDGVVADALYENGCMMELSLLSAHKASILGNIYMGRVKNIVKNIQAAFVEVEDGILCYLSLEDVKTPICAGAALFEKRGRLAQGDQILVQVSREAVKTKPPAVTTNLNLAGKYLVLTTGNPTVGYSSRLSAEEKKRLKTLLEGWKPQKAGLIVRTNAAAAGEEELREEYRKLLEQYQYLTGQAVHRRALSCVQKGRPAYLASILGSRGEDLKEIVTDDPGLYEQIQSFLLEEMPTDAGKLKLYEDPTVPLKAMCRMERGLSEALAERVWLKSGAYLVIEPTEALTVIDVNTGKCTKGKEKQETIQRINQEAAREIARQMRLRNLSGIIVADFVDMEEKEAQTRLLEYMREQLKRDPQKAAAVDMTGLGLMEMTRKKQRKTLAEQARECGI